MNQQKLSEIGSFLSRRVIAIIYCKILTNMPKYRCGWTRLDCSDTQTCPSDSGICSVYINVWPCRIRRCIWNSGGKSGENGLIVNLVIKVDVHIKISGFNKILPQRIIAIIAVDVAYYLRHTLIPGRLYFGHAGLLSIGSQQTQNICITFVQCWTNVEDVGTTLY